MLLPRGEVPAHGRSRCHDGLPALPHFQRRGVKLAVIIGTTSSCSSSFMTLGILQTLMAASGSSSLLTSSTFRFACTWTAWPVPRSQVTPEPSCFPGDGHCASCSLETGGCLDYSVNVVLKSLGNLVAISYVISWVKISEMISEGSAHTPGGWGASGPAGPSSSLGKMASSAPRKPFATCSSQVRPLPGRGL